jgi:hypothetical protein
MGRTLNEWIDSVRSIIGGAKQEKISDEDLEKYVYAAIRKFSGDAPRTAYSDYTGDGVSKSFTLPAGWQQGFSSPIGVEYPQGQNPPMTIDDAELSLYPLDTAPTTLLLRETTPAAATVARLYYMVSWPLPTSDPAIDLIPDVAFEPVSQLAAHQAFLQLAARSAGTGRNVGGSDINTSTPESQDYSTRARDAKKEYTDFLGGGDSGPASGWTDWDASSTFLLTGRRFLFKELRGLAGFGG